jgi:hypothetical protein
MGNHFDEDAPPGSLDPAFVLLIVLTFVLVTGVLLVKGIEARRHGNEAAAIGALRKMSTAQAIFREGDKENDGNLDYGMLSELSNAGLVDTDVGSGTKRGYLFQATYSFNTSEFLWFGVANPEVPGITGNRYFNTNQAGVIFYTSGRTLELDTDTCVLPNPAPLLIR